MRIYRVITTKQEMKVGASLNARHAVELATRAFLCPDQCIASVEYQNVGSNRWHYLYRNKVNGVFDFSKLDEQW